MSELSRKILKKVLTKFAYSDIIHTVNKKGDGKMQNRLKEFRNSINKTQLEIANIWGISLSFYKQIECGAKNPSIQTIKKFKEEFPTADTNKIFFT